MNRVVVLGCPGSGKSTFAIRLAQRTGLPLYHLDQLYWRPGWVESPQDEWHAALARVVAGERWIIDGNYSSTIGVRVPAADTVIYLDRSRLLCFWRVLGRRWKYRRQPRPDIAAACPEHLNWEFVRWIWNYPAQQKPTIERHFAALRPDQRLFCLQSDASVEQFLGSVPTGMLL